MTRRRAEPSLDASPLPPLAGDASALAPLAGDAAPLPDLLQGLAATFEARRAAETQAEADALEEARAALDARRAAEHAAEQEAERARALAWTRYGRFVAAVLDQDQDPAGDVDDAATVLDGVERTPNDLRADVERLRAARVACRHPDLLAFAARDVENAAPALAFERRRGHASAAGRIPFHVREALRVDTIEYEQTRRPPAGLEEWLAVRPCCAPAALAALAAARAAWLDAARAHNAALGELERVALVFVQGDQYPPTPPTPSQVVELGQAAADAARAYVQQHAVAVATLKPAIGAEGKLVHDDNGGDA